MNMPLTSNTTLYNKYELIQLIGSGNWGQVCLVQDLALNCIYALKILRSGLSIDERLREAQVGHRLDHNNLVRIHNADVTTDGLVLIAMDFQAKGSITRLANPSGFLALPDAVRSIIDVLQGLDHLHSLNIFHNDIKPQNILIGSQGQAMLSDYGIVGISPTGCPVLPPNWYVLHTAPEISLGTGIEVRTDIFQTGLTLFRLVVGLNYLESKYNNMGKDAYLAALSAGELITERDFPSYIPIKLRGIILKAINPNIDVRFASALEMRRALERLSFAGYWTVDSTGTLVGHGSIYEYRFISTQLNPRTFSITAYKKHKVSLRETMISAFSARNLSKAQLGKAENRFIKAVISGDL